MYILTLTAKRKGAKRHIVNKNENIDVLKKSGAASNNKYIVEIYTENWQLVEVLNK